MQMVLPKRLLLFHEFLMMLVSSQCDYSLLNIVPSV